MKLCMITSYPPERDGVGQYSFNLVNSLKKLVEDLEIVVVAHKINYRKEENIIRILHQKKVRRSYFQILEELKTLPRCIIDVYNTIKIIKEKKIDVVHLQYEPGLCNLFFAPMLFTFLKFYNVKKIITLHARDYFPLNIFHNFFLYNKPDKIIVHSTFHKGHIESRKPIQIILTGVISSGSRLEYSKNVMFYGFLSPFKGVETLLYAFKDVLEKISDSKLYIDVSINPKHVEEYEYKEKILNLAKEIGISKNVVYVKMVRNRLYEINAQIAVFPFKKGFSAGQSMSILDAIAAGKSIIITPVPGISELIKNGTNGFIVPFDDPEEISKKITELIEDKNKLGKIFKNNVNLARRRSWDNVAKLTYNLYKRTKIK